MTYIGHSIERNDPPTVLATGDGMTFCYSGTIVLVADFLRDLSPSPIPLLPLDSVFNDLHRPSTFHCVAFFLPTMLSAVGAVLLSIIGAGKEGAFSESDAYVLSVAVVSGLPSLIIPVTARSTERIPRTVRGTAGLMNCSNHPA